MKAEIERRGSCCIRTPPWDARCMVSARASGMAVGVVRPSGLGPPAEHCVSAWWVCCQRTSPVFVPPVPRMPAQLDFLLIGQMRVLKLSQ